METLTKIIDFLNDKFSFPVAIFCGFMIFAPEWVLKRLSLLEFASSAYPLISLVFVFAVILYLYGKGKKIAQYIGSKMETRAKRKARKRLIVAHVKGLTPEEKDWIYYCLKQNVRTLYTIETNTTAVSLESKTLIYRPKNTYNKLSTPFSFYTEVWNYLAKKKELYCPHEKLRDRQYNERVDRFIKNLRNTD